MILVSILFPPVSTFNTGFDQTAVKAGTLINFKILNHGYRSTTHRTYQ